MWGARGRRGRREGGGDSGWRSGEWGGREEGGWIGGAKEITGQAYIS